MDLNCMLRQDLVIMDGMIGMMGDGPIGGFPARAGLLMGSWNGVAADITAACIMGFPAAKIPILKLAVSAGLSSFKPEIEGMAEKDLKREWKKPLVAKNRFISGLLLALIDGFFHRARKNSAAAVDSEKCTGCGRCQDMCPYRAITMTDSKAVVNKELCRLCLCCTEVCTSLAIALKGSLPESFLRIQDRLAK